MTPRKGKPKLREWYGVIDVFNPSWVRGYSDCVSAKYFKGKDEWLKIIKIREVPKKERKRK